MNKKKPPKIVYVKSKIVKKCILILIKIKLE